MPTSILGTKTVAGVTYWLTHGPKQPWRIENSNRVCELDFTDSADAFRTFEALDGVPVKGNGPDLSPAGGFSYAAEPSVIGLDAMLPKVPVPVTEAQLGKSGGCWQCSYRTTHHPDCAFARSKADERAFDSRFTFVTCVGPVEVIQSMVLPRGRAHFGNTDGALDPVTLTEVGVVLDAVLEGSPMARKVWVSIPDFATLRAEAEGRKAGDVRQKFEQGVQASIERMHGALERQDAQDLTFKDLRPGDTIGGLRVVAVEPKDARDFGKALDRALPPSMSPRPGERCKVCGEEMPKRQSAIMGDVPCATGWMLVVFPVCEDIESEEEMRLCPPCGKRVAEYIAYCTAHPHPRDGE